MELKRVSRWWRDLISDVQFLRMHRDLDCSRICEFLINKDRYNVPKSRRFCVLSLDMNLDDDEYSEVKVSRFPVSYDWCTILDLHDGFLLINGVSYDQFTIYNNMTRSSLVLPKNKYGYPWFTNWKIAPNPSINGYTVVGIEQNLFGCWTVRRRPKFLFLELPELDLNNPRPASSSAAWTWKELGPPRHDRDRYLFFIEKGGVRKFGKLFWLANRYLFDSVKERYTRLKRTSLLSFDPATRQLKLKACSPMPRGIENGLNRLFNSNGTFYRTCPLSDNDFELWVLRELDRRPMWFKTHVIKKDHSITKWKINGNDRPMAVLQGMGKFVMLNGLNKKFRVYDMRWNEWTLIKVEGPDSDYENEEKWGDRFIIPVE